MRGLVGCCLCLSLFAPVKVAVAESQGNALHAKCNVNVRLIKATHENPKSVDSNSNPLSTEESLQLKALPFGSYSTVDMKVGETSAFTPIDFRLTASSNESFTVSVTPHSLADNKVNYTLEWSTPENKSVVATRLGVENGRSVMIGTTLPSESDEDEKDSSRCFIIGVKVECHS